MNRYPYRRRDDLVRMQALILATRPRERLGDFPSPHDLAGLLEQPDIRARTVTWWHDTTLVAYALVAGGELYTDTLPDWADALKPELAAWRGELDAQRSLETA